MFNRHCPSFLTIKTVAYYVSSLRLLLISMIELWKAVIEKCFVDGSYF